MTSKYRYTAEDVEILDAIADIFFTNEYMKYLYPNNPVCDEADLIITEALKIYGKEIILEVIDEVIRSNYSKFLPEYMIEDSDWEAPLNFLLLNNNYEGEISVRVVEEYVVFLDSNNKVMKPFSYEPPDIKRIVNKYSKRQGE